MTNGKQKILIVDDERFYINLLVDLLSEDYDITVAKNGKQAIERAADGPDLILLDIIMPEMDGYEVCQQLKTNDSTQDIPVIFLTVKSELNDEVLGFELGAVDYISKPISPAIVKARVATHLALQAARKNLYQQNESLITEQVIKDEQLRRSEKMASLGKLTGGIAHDFNNVLGIILGYAELMQKNIPETTFLSDYLAHIKKAGERGKNITQKLLAFSRQKAGQPEKLQINDLLAADYSMLSKTLTASIELTLDLDKNLWPVYLDKSDLQDAILNMCINAMHAMPAGGKLTLTVHNETLAAKNAASFDLQAGDYVRFTLTDTGCGMDQETQNQVFDPFFSTKGEKGTGLGMSQVYGFVNRSSGVIQLQSDVAQGTSINLYFPRYNVVDNVTALPTEQVSNEVNYTGDERVLVVDDEVSIAQIIEEILKSRGYHVFTAHNAESALKVLESEQVELIISDVIMPGMNGYEFANIAMQKYPDIKIQLLSGYSEYNHPSKTNDVLHEQLLQKPVSSKALLQRTRELLDS